MRESPSRAMFAKLPEMLGAVGKRARGLRGSRWSHAEQRRRPGGSVTAPMLPRAIAAELEGSVNIGGRHSGNCSSETAAALRMSEGFGAIKTGVEFLFCL